MTRMANSIASLAMLICLWVSAPAIAQVIPDAPVSKLLAAPSKKPQAIDVSEIPTRADTDERFADQVITRVSNLDRFNVLDQRLTAIQHSANEKFRMFSNEELRSLPIMRLNSLERHWDFDARQYARWQLEMQSATQPLAEDAAELGRRRMDWETTLVANPPGNLPATLSQRIESVVTHLKKAEQSLSAPLARQEALGRRANNVDARIQSGRRAIASANAHINRSLLRQDSPPLWVTTDTISSGRQTMQSMSKGLGLERDFLNQYAAADMGNQRLLRALQLLLLPLLIWMAWRNRRNPEAFPHDNRSQRVLQRPFSAWALLSMIGVLALEPHAPLMLHQLAMLVALVPVLRLLPAESQRLLGPWPYVATAAYLLLRLSFLFLANALIYRWYFCTISLLAMGFTLWLLWHSRDQLRHTQLERAVRATAWVTSGLFAVSSACNLFGNVSLSEMLTTAIIDSGYFGLILYAALNVATTLLRLLFKRRSIASLRVVQAHGNELQRLLIRTMTLAGIVGWLMFAMNRFRIFKPVYEVAHALVTRRLEYGELSISLGHILAFILAVFLAYWAARGTRVVLKEELLSRMALPRGVDNSIASLTYYALLLMGLLAALSAAGFKLGQLTFLFGALGVGVGLGLQDVVKNFVSGLILMFERPIKPGDVVDVGNTSGRVQEIGMRATTIKTYEGADVVVPNGTLLSERIVNWTLRDHNRRLDISIGVAYGSDSTQVAKLLQQTAMQTPGILVHPAPVVLFQGFGASSLNFEVRAWAPDIDNWLNLRSDLVTRIYSAMNEAGIEIPFPQQDLHLRTVSDAAGLSLGQARMSMEKQEPPAAPAAG